MATCVLVEVADLRCAFPVADVIETMRPLPVEQTSGGPDFLMGLAVVRGNATPVIDLAAFLHVRAGAAQRFLILRAGERAVAVAVTGVVGLVEISAGASQALPPLLAQDDARQLAIRDGEIVRILSAARILTDEQWEQLAGQLHAHR